VTNLGGFLAALAERIVHERSRAAQLERWFGVESIEQLLRRATEQIEHARCELEGWARSAKYFEEYRRILRHVDALRDVKQTLAAIQDGFGLSAPSRL
jgi:hypothetical protein